MPHLSALVLALAVPVAAVAQSTPAERIAAHVRVLASDSLEGRGTATRGYDAAARYVIAQFRDAGLAPGAGDGWLQRVPLRRASVDTARSAVEIVDGEGARTRLALGRDVVLLPGACDTTLEAPVVFVGHGVTAPEVGHDDYDGVDVRGKVVALLGGTPAAVTGDARAWYAATKGENAAAHGAVGVLRLWGADDERAGGWDVVARTLGGAVFVLADSGAGRRAARPRVQAQLGPAATAALLGHAAPPAGPVELLASVRLAVATSATDAATDNVVGLLRGSDPRLRDEYVVVTAHLDHLGIGTPVDGDSIYNGAVDNASGVAAMVEAARAVAAMPERPRRSLLFVAVGAEEPGSLGSAWLARHPPLPRGAIVANVNVDGGAAWAFDALVARGADHSTLARAVAAGAAAAGERVVPDPIPERTSLAGSDQWSFLVAGIPAVALGTARSGEARRLAVEWAATRYHAPGDDLTQPLDFEAGARFARALAAVAHAVAQAPERPRWSPGALFARTRAGSAASPPGRRARGAPPR
jgi:hypothetical protein